MIDSEFKDVNMNDLNIKDLVGTGDLIGHIINWWIFVWQYFRMKTRVVFAF